MPSQVYFESDGEGDWYRCVEEAASGQSPSTHPAKWERIEIPAFLGPLVAQLAVALMQPGEGQHDKGVASLRVGDAQLDGFILRHADFGSLAQPRVFSR